ncbi:Hydroxyacylglutathione hydrolase [uncultured archaeon]|nr:Hydroxyacylglutathione hydrolase [uncultured archaeon]
MLEVHLLKSGWIKREECGRIVDARSSVTLIVSGTRKIVVDTGLKGEEQQILKALAGLGFWPEEIDTVVNTHSHPDHCGNNHLFSRAKILEPKDGETIAPGVWTMETPGHSLDSISVIVKGFEIVVMAGDALPTFGNFQKNVPPAMHVDRVRALASMAKIVSLADAVVPGHDLPFSIRSRAYIQLSPTTDLCKPSAAHRLTK